MQQLTATDARGFGWNGGGIPAQVAEHCWLNNHGCLLCQAVQKEVGQGPWLKDPLEKPSQCWSAPLALPPPGSSPRRRRGWPKVQTWVVCRLQICSMGGVWGLSPEYTCELPQLLHTARCEPMRITTQKDEVRAYCRWSPEGLWVQVTI